MAKLFFLRDGALHYEFNELYDSLFKNPEAYIKIVKKLAEAPYGLTREDIIAKAKIQNNGTTSHVLEELEQCGFIEHFYPFGGGKNNLFYKLIDNFTLFYYHFLNSNKSTDENYWSHNIDSSARTSWLGLAFECVCFQHISQIKKAIGISGMSSSGLYSWKCKVDDTYDHGAQVDMIIDRADNIINLCEIKFSQQEYSITKEYDLIIRNRIGQFKHVTKTRKSIWPTFITTYGLKENKYRSTIPLQVTAKDLFEE